MINPIEILFKKNFSLVLLLFLIMLFFNKMLSKLINLNNMLSKSMIFVLYPLDLVNN